MPIRPRLSMLDLEEAEAVLEGIVQANLIQLRRGWRAVGESLKPDRLGRRTLRYIRSDPDEEWLTIRDIWRRGGGDCEDLAAALAAELRLAGFDARVVLRRVREGLLHALVAVDGKLIDPSRTGGMGQL